MQYIIKNKFRIILAVLAVAAVPFFSGCGSSSSPGYSVDLEIWGPFDDSLVYGDIITEYKKMNTHVREIKYRKFSLETYKEELIDGLASGNGPDIFLINNTWFPYFENKLYPAPTPFISPQDIKDNFPDVVYSDFVSENKAYAVPLAMDSMQLYYNKDMFNAVGITSPPKTWQELENCVEALTKIDQEGKIIRSGAAIGTAKNVNRSTDLISLLMLQYEAKLPMKKGELASFDEGAYSLGSGGEKLRLGEAALDFYTKFAKINDSNGNANRLYTWNAEQVNSVDAFAGGSVAMLFNYAWQNSVIKNKNPKLNYDIAPIPQVSADKPVTIANYWGFAVSSNKNPRMVSQEQSKTKPVSNDARAHEAWEFLRFLTLKNNGKITLYNALNTKSSMDFLVDIDPALDYIKKTLQPAARRDIIKEQKNDLTLGVFASGNLFAKNWYQKNPEKIDGVFTEMIETVNSGGTSLHDALVLARGRVNSLQEN